MGLKYTMSQFLDVYRALDAPYKLIYRPRRGGTSRSATSGHAKLYTIPKLDCNMFYLFIKTS